MLKKGATSGVMSGSTKECSQNIRHISLRFLSNSLSSPRFNLLRVARCCFSWFSVFLFSHLILSLSFLCSSVSVALFGPRNSAQAFLAYVLFVWVSHRHTYIHTLRLQLFTRTKFSEFCYNMLI